MSDAAIIVPLALIAVMVLLLVAASWLLRKTEPPAYDYTDEPIIEADAVHHEMAAKIVAAARKGSPGDVDAQVRNVAAMQYYLPIKVCLLALKTIAEESP